MPGRKLSSTETKLLHRWKSETAAYPFPTLRSISVKGSPGLRGLQDIKVEFRHPLSVVCGRNGSGKTTILALAALAHHSPNGHIPFNARRPVTRGEDFSYYTFVDFFFKGPTDPDITGIEIVWEYDNNRRLEIHKRTEKWMHYERRPIRPVHYLGVIRSVPAIEQPVLRNYFSSRKKEKSFRALNETFVGFLNRIMGREYNSAAVHSSSRYQVRSCLLRGSNYSSFNMGAGEDILIDLLYQLQEAKNGSLIVVEEIELGLHPEALIRLAEILQEIMHLKSLQIIVSTHSRDFIDNVPRESRILIERVQDKHYVLPGLPTKLAISKLSGISVPELTIYCEDHFASILINQALRPDLLPRVNIVPVGSDNNVAKYISYHYTVHPGQKVLAVWDGDVSTRVRDISSWLRPELTVWTQRPSREHDPSKMLSWIFLPSARPPEEWVLSILNSEEGFRAVAFELDIDEVRAASLLEQLIANRDAKLATSHIAKIFCISEQEANRVLVRASAKLPSAPLRCIQEKVARVLSGETVQEGAVIEKGATGNSITYSIALNHVDHRTVSPPSASTTEDKSSSSCSSIENYITTPEFPSPTNRASENSPVHIEPTFKVAERTDKQICDRDHRKLLESQFEKLLSQVLECANEYELPVAGLTPVALFTLLANEEFIDSTAYEALSNLCTVFEKLSEKQHLNQAEYLEFLQSVNDAETYFRATIIALKEEEEEDDDDDEDEEDEEEQDDEDEDYQRIIDEVEAERVKNRSWVVPSLGAVKLGQQLMHAKFGIGKVVQIIGEGDKSLLNMDFEQAGRRLLDPRFAKLQKFDNTHLDS